MIQVYRKLNGVETPTITISDKNASCKSGIMGVDEVRVSVVVDIVLDICEGDYIKQNGINYTLNRDAEYTKKSDVEFSYDLVFEHPLYTLFDKLFVNKITGSAIDTITGKARDFIEQIVWCVNKTTSNPLGVDTGWTIGIVDDNGFKTITFDSISCRDMLSLVCEIFNIEFFLNNKEINCVSRIENETSLIFEQGRGKGLYTVSQLNVDKDDTVTRIYPVGGNQNVPNANADYNGNLKLPEIYLENFQDFDKVVERKVVFDDVFPEFIGNVDTVSGENNKEIVSNKIDFDLNKIAVGDNARINFLTGDLMGVSFEFQYDHAQKKITLIPQEDEVALPDEDGNKPQIPQALKKPNIGDEFNFTGVIMPASYVNNAISKLREKATDWLEFHSRKRVKFELDIDYRFMRGKQKLKVGDLITLKIPEKNTQKLIRVTEVEENLYTGAINATISNYLDEKWERKIEGQISQLQTSVAGGGRGGDIDIIERFDQRRLTDKNVMSSLRSKSEFLSKKESDTAAELIKFFRGAEFGQFFPGIEIGSGGHIDREGNAELQSLIIRSFLKVPQLIYNKVSVTGGEMWNTEGAVIKSVTPDGENAYILELDIEDGDHIELQVDDICKGHYNNSGGFVTSYFRVTHINDASNTIRIVLGANSEVPGGINHPPVPYMNIARYGSFTVRERQRSQYFSSTEGYIVLLDFVDNYKIDPRHYRAVFGNIPPSLLPDNLPINKNDAGIYLKNVIAENFFQLDNQGNPVKIIRDRGLWTENPQDPYLCNTQYQDEVYCDSCKYRCINEGTTERPAYNSTDWLLVAGDTELTLTIYSTNGESFLWGRMDTTLIAVVKRGVTNITASILAVDWKWTRTTGDVVSDTIWNNTHSGNAESVHITDADMNGVSGVFTCEAYVRDGNLLLTESISF